MQIKKYKNMKITLAGKISEILKCPNLFFGSIIGVNEKGIVDEILTSLKSSKYNIYSECPIEGDRRRIDLAIYDNKFQKLDYGIEVKHHTLYQSKNPGAIAKRDFLKDIYKWSSSSQLEKLHYIQAMPCVLNPPNEKGEGILQYEHKKSNTHRNPIDERITNVTKALKEIDPDVIYLSETRTINELEIMYNVWICSIAYPLTDQTLLDQIKDNIDLKKIFLDIDEYINKNININNAKELFIERASRLIFKLREAKKYSIIDLVKELNDRGVYINRDTLYRYEQKSLEESENKQKNQEEQRVPMPDLSVFLTLFKIYELDFSEFLNWVLPEEDRKSKKILNIAHIESDLASRLSFNGKKYLQWIDNLIDLLKEKYSIQFEKGEKTDSSMRLYNANSYIILKANTGKYIKKPLPFVAFFITDKKLQMVFYTQLINSKYGTIIKKWNANRFSCTIINDGNNYKYKSLIEAPQNDLDSNVKYEDIIDLIDITIKLQIKEKIEESNIFISNREKEELIEKEIKAFKN